MFKQEPLSSTYMLISLMGFIVSAIMIDVVPSWAFAFMMVFIVMFISSVISMSNVPFEYPDLLEELNVHDPMHHKKKWLKSTKKKPKRKYKK